MRSKKILDLAAMMRNDGKSYGHIARSLNVCNQSAVNLCNYSQLCLIVHLFNFPPRLSCQPL